jgi:hypothetical protein
VLLQATPFLDARLAVGRRISQITFCGQELTDKMILSDSQVRIIRNPVVGMTTLEGGNQFLHIHTKPVVRVWNGATQVEILLDAWDPKAVTTGAIRTPLCALAGLSPHTTEIVRIYPTARPMLCRSGHFLYGYAGEVRKQLALRQARQARVCACTPACWRHCCSGSGAFGSSHPTPGCSMVAP